MSMLGLGGLGGCMSVCLCVYVCVAMCKLCVCEGYVLLCAMTGYLERDACTIGHMHVYLSVCL